MSTEDAKTQDGLTAAVKQLLAVDNYPLALVLVGTNDGTFILHVMGNGAVTNEQFQIVEGFSRAINRVLHERFGTETTEQRTGPDHGMEIKLN